MNELHLWRSNTENIRPVCRLWLFRQQQCSCVSINYTASCCSRSAGSRNYFLGITQEILHLWYRPSKIPLLLTCAFLLTKLHEITLLYKIWVRLDIALTTLAYISFTQVSFIEHTVSTQDHMPKKKTGGSRSS